MTPAPSPRNLIKSHRLAQGLTQAELAARAGISRTAVTAIENGRIVPSVTAALSLAAALGRCVEELFDPGQEDFQNVAWAWPPVREPSRFWEAEVHGRTLRYPVELTVLGELPHDGRDDAPDDAPNNPERPRRDPRETLVMAGCDPAASLLAAEFGRHSRLRLLPLLRSSRQALELLERRLVHVAGVHLSSTEASQGNLEVVKAELGAGYRLLRLADWEEGVAYLPGAKPRTTRSLLQSKTRWVGREPGSGARQCLDELLGARPSPRRIAYDHRGVANAVRCGWADAGVCLRLAGEGAGLDFLSLRWERYDLCFHESLADDPRLRALVASVQSMPFRAY